MYKYILGFYGVFCFFKVENVATATGLIAAGLVAAAGYYFFGNKSKNIEKVDNEKKLKKVYLN